MNSTMTAEVSACAVFDITSAANKWLTTWRYAHGYLSFEGCQAAFKAHPEWRSA